MRRFFNTLFLRLLGHKPSRPEDIPQKLKPDMLKAAMDEARFLRGQHAVDARELRPDEIPRLPRMADPTE